MIFRELNRAHRAFLRRAQTHPKSLAMAILGGSTVAGVVLFRIIDGNDGVRGVENLHARKMSLEEARLIAMVENARESSWRENIENAVNAQEQFMLPGRRQQGKNLNSLMEKIDKRSQEIIRDQHQEIDQYQTKRKAETEAKAKDNISYWK
ncbi:unnamed protein product [Pseudo-nitzschia multistriata]|uniref:Uncharacterized protein n=1 Tax=Pseudo-nitzschia multistriata TaxID=183589 RepID=A0A448ZRT0_9STRA|nr:unnamed protein product [Pseudo-nitzschia multistriata]